MSNNIRRKVFENTFNVRLVDKSSSLLMRVVGFILKPFTPGFMTNFFTTYRLPFQKYGTIAYPSGTDPMWFMDILEHELMHVEQQRTTFGLIKSALFVSIFPLPILFSGRWFIERYPYLMDIKKGNWTIDQAVDILWRSYGWAWPKLLMKKWFENEVKKHNGYSNI